MKNCILCKDHKFCPEWKTVQVNIRNIVCIGDDDIQICQLAFVDQSRYNAGELNAGMEMASNCSDYVAPSWKK